MWQWIKEWHTENKGELQQNHDVIVGAAAVGEKARLGTKQHQTVQKSSP